MCECQQLYLEQTDSSNESLLVVSLVRIVCRFIIYALARPYTALPLLSVDGFDGRHKSCTAMANKVDLTQQGCGRETDGSATTSQCVSYSYGCTDCRFKQSCLVYVLLYNGCNACLPSCLGSFRHRGLEIMNSESSIFTVVLDFWLSLIVRTDRACRVSAKNTKYLRTSWSAPEWTGAKPPRIHCCWQPHGSAW